MEGHRYADDEPSWYPGKSQYARSTDPDTSGSHSLGNPYDSGIHERPSGAFRLPEQRPGAANPYALTDPLNTGSPDYEARIPVRGTEYPTVPPSAAPQIPPAAAIAESPVSAPTSMVPPISAGRPTPESVYQSRRPVTSFVVAIVMVILMIPVVRLLLTETFTGDPSPRGIVPAVLLTLGFTLTGIGLFAVARGGPLSLQSWLRPPVAYLPAGLLLLFAAGLAVA
ncbi:hypothetical protein [Paractinoplanes rishiriensis]|uniref:hypothetical protein n=1 Tax=Paractinoplanes rishiriensis TaxID=1050105 RepID=UPI0019403D86|nr:hypothetical protein [Actinoplanes rishiriensis]